MEMKVDNINKIIKFNVVLDQIKRLVEANKYEDAYYKGAAMLEFINSTLILKKIDVNFKDTDIINIIKIYSNNDEYLFKQMISINMQYNLIEKENINEDDIEYLLIKTDEILGYIINKYGNIIE